MADALDYLKKVNDEFSKLNRTITTEIKVDEDKIVRRLEQKLKRELTSRTMEFSGL